MREKHAIRFLVCALGLVAVIFFEYGESFLFYFVGDDFAFIEFALNEKTRMLWKSVSHYHYCPLGTFLNALPAFFGLLDPRWFVAVNFMLFWSASILVMRMYRNIAGGLIGGFLAALIFSTAVPNSEVIYWKTCTLTIGMTVFSLASLPLFMLHLKTRSQAAFVGTAASFAASMLCIESGAVTFGILFLYDLILFSIPQVRTPGCDRKGILLRFIRRHLILLSVPVSLIALKFALKLQLSTSPLSTRSWDQMLRLAFEAAASLIDFNNIILPVNASPSAFRLAAILALLSFLAYILIKRSAAALFFLLASLGSMLAISLATGFLASRYFCLPLAFFACFLSLFISDVAGALARQIHRVLAGVVNSPAAVTRMAVLLHIAIWVGASLSIAWIGLRGNLVRRDYWKCASLIERNIVESVESLYKSGAVQASAGQKVYLLDIPWYILSRQYLFFFVSGNSLMPDLRHRLGETAAGIEVIASRYSFEMTIMGERVEYRTLGHSKMMDRRAIESLINNGHIVLQFSPRAMTLVPVTMHP